MAFCPYNYVADNLIPTVIRGSKIQTSFCCIYRLCLPQPQNALERAKHISFFVIPTKIREYYPYLLEVLLRIMIMLCSMQRPSIGGTTIRAMKHHLVSKDCIKYLTYYLDDLDYNNHERQDPLSCLYQTPKPDVTTNPTRIPLYRCTRTYFLPTR